MLHKETWFIILKTEIKTGVGECGILRGLSIDDTPYYENKLQWACHNINLGLTTLLAQLNNYPSIQFGLEQAFKSLESQSSFNLFPSNFTKAKDSILINGLVWMGNKAYMQEQISTKINAGFQCIKLKIGAIDFRTELDILKSIRTEFSASDIEIRVDANGAFTVDEALEKLKQLSDYQLHSIEQPIRPNQLEEMARLCETSPLPIALDEELIGVTDETKKVQLLQMLNPKYIILKPSLLGGYQGSEQWINIANKTKIGWWITSALESNIGLNAIAQWTYSLANTMPQGLGTGTLFTNNITSPLEVNKGRLWYKHTKQWDFNF